MKLKMIDLWIVWILFISGFLTQYPDSNFLELVFGFSLASMAGYLCFKVWHLPPADDDNDQEPTMFI